MSSPRRCRQAPLANRIRYCLTTLLSFLGSAMLVASCSSGQTGTQSTSIDSPAPQTKAEARPSASISTSDSPIRLVDFNNIAYPHLPDYSDDERRNTTLKAGKVAPAYLNYGDITGDGLEEAMIVFGLPTRGSAIPHYIYVFTMESGRPKPIWDFETGDRADGGLRQIYAENGHLVIELYGKDRVIGGDLYQGDEGLCCPSSFTRARYKWKGKQFELISKETLAKPPSGASVIMPHVKKE